jgi:hypothetical protein
MSSKEPLRLSSAGQPAVPGLLAQPGIMARRTRPGHKTLAD